MVKVRRERQRSKGAERKTCQRKGKMVEKERVKQGSDLESREKGIKLMENGIKNC